MELTLGFCVLFFLFQKIPPITNTQTTYQAGNETVTSPGNSNVTNHLNKHLQFGAKNPYHRRLTHILFLKKRNAGDTNLPSGSIDENSNHDGNAALFEIECCNL